MARHGAIHAEAYVCAGVTVRARTPGRLSLGTLRWGAHDAVLLLRNRRVRAADFVNSTSDRGSRSRPTSAVLGQGGCRGCTLSPPTLALPRLGPLATVFLGALMPALKGAALA